MRILVVGGAGYIGSVTVDQMVEADHEVTVLDSLVSGHRQAVNREAEFVRADVRDEEQVRRLFASHNFQAVINYGGYIQAGESMVHPDRYFANNLGGCISLLNSMVAFGVGTFVFSSSAAVYGEPERTPITEDAAIRPVNPYGESKAIVERLLPWYERQYRLRYACLRYFNAAGATDLRGEDHQPETHLIPIVLQAAAGKRPFIPLFGRDYPTPDGSCVRDYIHVSDLAAAHLLALTKAEKESGTYNLGNGKGFSNLEVIEAARKVTGVSIEVREEERRPGDPAVLVASSEKARKELHWRPRLNRLEDIIESAWHWHSEHPAGYGE